MQVPNCISGFISYVQTHFKEVKHIRSDNGIEIFQDFCSELFKKSDILHQRSAPRTPQQHGRVERKHRHLIETTKAMRIHANLPHKIWGSCILAATYIINRLPTAVLNWKSPFEKMFSEVLT